MKRLLVGIVLTALTALAPILAQDSLSIILKGYVVDKMTRKPVSDAQIHVNNSRVATMTNSDGRFGLRVSKMPEQLIVSMMGYENAILTREELDKALPTRADKEGKMLHIQLVPNPKYLDEVYVYSPQNIVYAALGKVKENYPTEGQLYDTFYRETIRKRRTYVSVSEAVMQLFKTSYEDESIYRDKVFLQKGRSLMSQRAKDTVSVHVKGGPNESLLLDLVKNRESFLCPAVLNDYELTFVAPVQINDRAQCVIAFKPKANLAETQDALFTGKMYVDYKTLAFTRIEYNLDVSDPQKVTNMLLAKKPLGMRFKPRGLDIVMNYYYDGKCSRLSYLKTTYSFDCDWKKRGFRTPYEAVSEMLITGYQEPVERPRGRKAFSAHDLLSHEVRDFDDPDFWKDYNILLPSESLENAMRKLMRRQ